MSCQDITIDLVQGQNIAIELSNANVFTFEGLEWNQISGDQSTINLSAFNNDSGFISDYTVTQADVTQHQAALSITESQISDLGNYLTTETDPTVPAHVKNITTTKKSNWDSAFSWGDHNVEGYLKNITGLNISELNNNSGYITDYNVTNSDLTGLNISELTNDSDYITGYTVTENDVTQYESNLTITESQISDLDKYSQIEVNNLLDGKVDSTNFNSHINNTSVHFTLTDVENEGYIKDYTVTNSDLTGLNISELNNDTDFITTYTVTESDITQHEAALSITESQISDLGNYVATGDSPSFTDISYSTATSTIPAFSNLGSTYTVDFATGTHFSGILNSDVTLTFSNAVSGDKITLILEYDGTAQRVITYPSGIMWSGGSEPDTPASIGKLVITILYDGVNYLASGVVFE